MTHPNEPFIQILMGQALGDYTLGQFIANGAFGFVFEAAHAKTGRAVAVKVLSPSADPAETSQFHREGQLLTQLRRASNVVTIFETADHQIQLTDPRGIGVPMTFRYHILELASGCLEEIVAAKDRLGCRGALELWWGVVLGVHQMHLKEVVHRDIKSSNCLIFVGPKNAVLAKVGDLGRSRDLRVGPQFAPEEYICGRGDLRFAPPEYLWMQGSQDASGQKLADIYGLGSLLFELFAGHGITAFALGLAHSVIREAIENHKAGIYLDLSGLRGKYKPAMELFGDCLPRSIRKSGVDLLRQLCDPVPENRLPKANPANRVRRSDGLEWLLRRADILIKGLARETSHTPPILTLKGA